MMDNLKSLLQRYRENMPAYPGLNEILKKDICIAICNQKGGCAKTTTAINLASTLAERGYRVLIVDLDPQAHATLGLGLKLESFEKTLHDVLIHNASLESIIQHTLYGNLNIAPSNSLLSGAQLELADIPGRESVLKMALRELKVRRHYDFIIFDCSPSLNLVTINALVATEYVLIPIQTHYYSLEGMRELFSTIDIVKEKLNMELAILGILPTLFDARMRINHIVLEEIREYFKDMVLKTVVHNSVKLCEAPIYRKPINVYAPDSKGALDYRMLADEVIELIKERDVINNANETNAAPEQIA